MYSIDAVVQGKRLRLRVHDNDLFVPNLMSWYSAAQMRVVPGEAVCDVGLGSGLHAILAAKLGARRVYGTDVSPLALRWARGNARLNGVEGRCSFFEGSLIEPLAARNIRADLLVCNVPQFPGPRVDSTLSPYLRASVDGGESGAELNARFLRAAPRALKRGGRIYTPVVGWSGPAKSLRAVRAGGYRWRELSRIQVPPWGRGNRTREWLRKRPGKHVFRFDASKRGRSLARILELRLDGAAWDDPADLQTVRIDFRIR